MNKLHIHLIRICYFVWGQDQYSKFSSVIHWMMTQCWQNLYFQMNYFLNNRWTTVISILWEFLLIQNVFFCVIAGFGWFPNSSYHRWEHNICIWQCLVSHWPSAGKWWGGVQWDLKRIWFGWTHTSENKTLFYFN